MRLDAEIVMSVDDDDPDPPVLADVDILVRSLLLESGRVVDMWHCTRCGGSLIGEGMMGIATSMKYPNFNDHMECPDDYS